MKVLSLAPGRVPKKPTALRPSKTLGEHAEAFKSRNGYEVAPPPDTSGEINGIISEIMQLKYVTRKEIAEAGRQIRKLSDKKFALNIGSRLVFKALGYVDFQDASNRNENKDTFENLNFDRKDLAGINRDINDNEEAIYLAVTVIVQPYFEKVFALPHEKGWFKGPRCKTTGEFMRCVHPYLEHLGWKDLGVEETWAFAHALAFRYPHLCNIATKKGMFRNARPDATRKQVFDACRRLAREMGWGPKAGEIYGRDIDRVH